MSEKIISFCDFCNPNQQIGSDKAHSYVYGTEEDAIEYFDFIRTKKKLKCPECQDQVIL